MPTNYRWSTISAEDTPAWADLCNTLARVDDTDEFYEAADLAEELDEDGFDPAQDSWAIYDDAVMMGYGQLRVGHNPGHDGLVQAYLSGGIHPDYRRQGLGTRLMEVMEARATALLQQRHPGKSATFAADGLLEGATVRILLEARGYSIVRYFNQLVRDVPGAALESQPIPDGLRLVTIDSADLSEAVRTAHNAAFRDHWGSSELTPQAWRDRWTARANRHDVSTAVLDESGQVLAYVLCGTWVARELYIATVGTVAEARGRGLAKACIAETLRLAGESGDYDRADLPVDSVNPTGATRLYEHLGFTPRRVFAAYRRNV